MARIKQGFLGNASGKLGNIVFSRWRNLETARQYQPDIQDANSPEQQKQRSRMVSLLQFLKPLNKTFIKFFNSSISKGSTPWAVAIKNNMKGVSPDGTFPLQNLRLGTPKYPPFTVIESIYNPFLDQLQVLYKGLSNYQPVEPFPNVGCAALGKYPSNNGVHNFDVRHQLFFSPTGCFYSKIYGSFNKQAFYNWWKEGLLWFMYFDRMDIEHQVNPNMNLTEPAFFSPVPLIKGFNTNIEENPVPLDAISWEYTQISGKSYIVLKINYAKSTLVEPINYTMILWGVALFNGQYFHTKPYEWNLGSETKSFELNEEWLNGSGIALYSVFRNDGVQVGCFNRFYVNSVPNSNESSYFEQLFNCNYAFPSSFILSDNECGFCGYIQDIFSDFINLYNQGIIKYFKEPVQTVQYLLTLGNSINGTVNILNFFRREDRVYFFLVDEKAKLIPQPAPGFTFSKWAGADANDVQIVEPGTFELLMNKNRSVYAEYVEIPAPITQYPLTILNSVNGSINVSNFLSKTENVYILANGANALLSPQPEPGFVFFRWAGPDAADVLLLEPGNYALLMNKSRSIYAEFMPV